MEVDKVFNDCVHGHIRLHPLCVRIIDTPQFQRLRSIKQVGPTYLVYPGASHNRFEHSLGVCYLAGQLVDALNKSISQNDQKDGSEYVAISKTEKLCVQIAGLCHDIGHGPFSHTWERVLAARNIDFDHEEASLMMFDYLISANKLDEIFNFYFIKEKERKLIKEIIVGKGDVLSSEKRFLYQIVSNKDNDIDVDKWDYFLRDGLQLNLKITFDYRRLLEFCSIVEVPSKGDGHPSRVIGFRDKEANNLYDMFRVRTSLHQRAYQHRTSRNIEQMLVDAFVKADEAEYKIRFREKLVRLCEAHKDMQIYTYLNDKIFDSILMDPDRNLEPAQKILERIINRQLYKEIGDNYKLRLRDTNETECNDEVKKIKLVEKEIKRKYNEHEFCFVHIKLDFGRHVNSLQKVLFFNKQSSKCPTELTNLKMSDIIGMYPVPQSDESERYVIVEVLPFCKTFNLDERIRSEMDNDTRAEMRKMFGEKFLENNNN